MGLSETTFARTSQSVVRSTPGQSEGCSSSRPGGSSARAAGSDMYHVVSRGFSPMCFPRILPRMRSSEPAQMETKHTSTPSSMCCEPATSLEFFSSASVARPAQATPVEMRPVSAHVTLGNAPGWKIPMTACMASVTSGRQERITRFSEMAMRDRLKLLSPMLPAKAKERHRTTANWRAESKRCGSQRQFAAQEAASSRLTARKATTCWAPVMRNAAGTPFKPSSLEMLASERTSFM
mmetsp:Transcript_124467/g.363452  ORF Transcript_124467/g.363452 Transcript_124467/m.363452 type:complete len:237 (-) Transcript_124467:297-1007(-)